MSGIGCSSRFPHYMSTYGFHGLHGRAFPVAMGIKSRRPDLDVWLSTGDGDCCSIGAGHWVHAIRYNMNMVAMLFDNNIYGLTKKQTSPTSPQGLKTNTHPRGAWLPPINPLATTLGMTNVSFVAQAVDWNPVLLYDVLHAAWKHKGLGFVRILQRCPTYTDKIFNDLQNDPTNLTLLRHDKGIAYQDSVLRSFPNHAQHDPSDLFAAQRFAGSSDTVPVGLLFQDESRPRYDDFSRGGLEMNVDEKLQGLQTQLDRFAI